MRIEVNGPIINDGDQWIYDWFEIPATSPKKVKNLIDKAASNNIQELIVTINSGGGSVYAASEIYTFLKSFAGNVKTQIVGMAASAASVIAMAGYTEMSPTGMLMIHNAATRSEGDYHAMDETSDFLQKVNRTITNAYRMKTSKSEEELLSLMDRTTWMTAQEAKEAGFVDAIMFENELDAVASIEHPQLVNGVIPKQVIDKLRQQLKNQPDVVNIIPKEEPKAMNLEQIKNDHPELYEQIKNEGKEEAVKAERTRLQEIDNITPPGLEDLANKAKFETGISAEAFAVEALKTQKEQNKVNLTNYIADATEFNNIEAAESPIKTSNKDVEVDNLLNKVTGEVK